MNDRPEVRVGQRYTMGGRTVEVLSLKLQAKTEGRFKARYTYATVEVQVPAGPMRRVKIDTDRLRSSAYTLVFNPCPVTDEGTQDAPRRLNDAATPQQEP
jgi:hypothetical protein